MFQLDNKTAFITGAGSGIGKATALLFAARGAEVIVCDLSDNAANETVLSIMASGGKATAIVVNVANQAELLTTMAGLDSLDILVNSAGISHIGKLESTQPEDMDRLYAVNIKGVYNAMFVALPLLQKNGGVILNLASIAANVGIADRFAYSMTKGAVKTMSLSVARDYIHQGIRCNCISPGRVHTPFVDGFLQTNYPGKEEEIFQKLSASQPIGRMAKPEEIAALALYLCSDEAAFITGCDYFIDGGFINLNN